MAFDPLGLPCDDRSATGAQDHTKIVKDNPASANGTIDTCQVWGNGQMTGVEYAVFTDNGGNSLTCQAGHHTNGSNLTAAAGSCTTHTAAGNDFTAFEVDSGEYLAYYNPTGNIEADTSGVDGMWIAYNSDEIYDDNTQTFGVLATWRLSFRATGTEGNGAVAPTGALYGPLVGPMAGPI